MPRCVAKFCRHATGRKSEFPNITLHSFPRSVEGVQTWLRLAGMDGKILEEHTRMIVEDHHRDKFRMCSAHFTEDCFLMKGVHRGLKEGALPTLFHNFGPVFDPSLDPWVKRTKRMQRLKEPKLDFSVDPPVWVTSTGRCCCRCHRLPAHPRGNLVDASTQTDGSCIVFTLTGIPSTKPASQQTIGMDHDYGKSEESESSQDLKPVVDTAMPVRTCVLDIKTPPSKDSQQEERSRQAGKFCPSVPGSVGIKEEEDFLMVHVKEEPLSDEEYLPYQDICAPGYSNQSPTTHTVEQPILFEEEPIPYEMDYTTVVEDDLAGPPHSSLSMPIHRTQCPSTHVKEEPSDPEPLQPDLTAPTHGTQRTSVHIKEEALSEHHPYSTQLPSVHIKEEPISEEEHLPEPELSTQVHCTQSKSLLHEKHLEEPKYSSSPQCALKKRAPKRHASNKHALFSNKKPPKILGHEGLLSASSSSMSHPSTETTNTVNNCSKCKESFSSLQELSQHYKIHHAKLSGNSDHSDLSCFQCDIKFQSMEEMMAHRKRHPLTCQYCGKLYKSVYQLSKHELLHKVISRSSQKRERCLASVPFLQEAHEAEKLSDKPESDQNFMSITDSGPHQQVHWAPRLITVEKQDPETLPEDPEGGQNVPKEPKMALLQDVHTASMMTICFKCGRCFNDESLPKHSLQKDWKIHPCPQCA
ncbi:zinc finger protein 624-like [Hyperolius riggenbachi]|uniref:zinc finger protein 624-like n=1 Tax=Hyperolius riggenbachi TaxID=752182 RepID=UPI0035A27ADF